MNTRKCGNGSSFRKNFLHLSTAGGRLYCTSLNNHTRYKCFQLFGRISRLIDDKNCFAVKYCCHIFDLVLDVYVTWVTP